jgi:hypothetical protein
MKNIHLLPTEKYSDLVYSTSKYGGLFLSRHYSPMKEMGDSYQYIYITNDEEIKDCWVLNTKRNEVYFCKDYLGIQPNCKKIILTTNQELIADGVQAIDDKFLEWFIKNPSCEFVEIKNVISKYFECVSYIYKIIIREQEEDSEFKETNSIPTAKEFIEQNLIDYSDGGKAQYIEEDVEKALIEFAKLHVDLIEQAKEMDKNKMMDFANWCRIHDAKYPNQVWTIQQLFEKYEKETFKSE